MKGVSVFVLLSLFDVAGAQRSLRASRDAVYPDQQTELFALLGQGRRSLSGRLERLQDEIRPMYEALQKGKDGMDAAVVRYILHRFLSNKHGWRIEGLYASNAESWTDGSVIDVFRDRVPQYVLKLLTQRLQKGVGLDELAIVAATLEDLVHADNMEMVFLAFSTLGLPTNKVLTEEESEHLFKIVTFFFFVGKVRAEDLSQRPNVLDGFLQEGGQVLLHWDENLLRARDLEQYLAHEDRHSQNPFVEHRGRSFDSIVRFVEMMADRQGQQQRQECTAMKNELMDLEDVETGRIGLSKFYNYVPEGEWQQPPFSETPEYLRHLGALDESDPVNPRVMVANYLQGKSNCASSSDLFSVCCVNECDGLIVEVERRVKDSSASPSLIAEIISALPSPTVSAPHKLSASLGDLLASIAHRHGGTIPIHGRLFAQWMHRVYPNECQYPHARGTIGVTMSPLDWMVGRGSRAYLSTGEEMQEAMANFTASHKQPTTHTMPWSDVEELIVERPQQGSVIRPVLRCISGVLAVGSAFVALSRMVMRPLEVLPTKASKSHYV